MLREVRRATDRKTKRRSTTSLDDEVERNDGSNKPSRNMRNEPSAWAGAGHAKRSDVRETVCGTRVDNKGASSGNADHSAICRQNFIKDINSKRSESLENIWDKAIEALAPVADEDWEVAYHALLNMHDLYRPENIIGYTQSSPDTLPTIYYNLDSLHGSITQEHANPDNIGASLPIKSDNYVFENRLVDNLGTLLFEEEPNLGFSHTSRSSFVPISDVTDEKFRELVEAGEKEVTLKQIYRKQFGFEFIRKASGQ